MGLCDSRDLDILQLEDEGEEKKLSLLSAELWVQIAVHDDHD